MKSSKHVMYDTEEQHSFDKEMKIAFRKILFDIDLKTLQSTALSSEDCMFEIMKSNDNFMHYHIYTLLRSKKISFLCLNFYVTQTLYF